MDVSITNKLKVCPDAQGSNHGFEKKNKERRVFLLLLRHSSDSSEHKEVEDKVEEKEEEVEVEEKEALNIQTLLF